MFWKYQHNQGLLYSHILLLHSGCLLGFASVWSLRLAHASSSDQGLKYLPEGNSFCLPANWGSLSYFRPSWLFLEARGSDGLTVFKRQFRSLHVSAKQNKLPQDFYTALDRLRIAPKLKALFMWQPGLTAVPWCWSSRSISSHQPGFCDAFKLCLH